VFSITVFTYYFTIIFAFVICFNKASSFALRRGNFGDSATNKGYIAYFSLRMRETAVFPLPV